MADLREVVSRALCSHWSSEHEEPNDFDFAGADRVLAALAGRIAPEVDGDVVEAAAKALVPFCYGAFELQRDENGERVRPAGQPNSHALKAVRAIALLIAAATDRRVRAEIMAALPKIHGDGDNGEWESGFDEAVEQCQAAIRTGAAS